MPGRGSHILTYLPDKTLWGFPDIVTEGLFRGPGVPHAFEANSEKNSLLHKVLPWKNSGFGRGHEIYMTRNIGIIFLFY